MTSYDRLSPYPRTGDSGAPARDPVAIVGIGCRFPGGLDSPAIFWASLLAGLDAVGPIPAERLGLSGAAALAAVGDPPGQGGWLTGIDRFDAAFFGLSPREAARLDPQQRLLLEVACEAVEDAGLPLDRLAGTRTAVFIGLWLGDFEAQMFRDTGQADLHMTTGSGRYAAAGRLSYALGLEGPSLVVDTACSSSLVAVHLACRSLWSGEATLALAGGANVILQPHITLAYDRAGMLAADGRCKFADARADGYVRGEGAGIVVLKPLDRALADGDPIYAVILGGAVNNDGRGSGQLVTPAATGQANLLRLAYADAGVPPGTVRYVEAHGTGTAVGDPVELAALDAVLSGGRPPDEPCAVGSVKTNFGHTEGAAGVAGLIKTALVLRHRLIPPSLHFDTPTPAVHWAEVQLHVPRAATPLPPAGRLVAGVSAFGITGTNAHLVLATPPEVARPGPADLPGDGRAWLVPLSAHTPAALNQRARDLAGHVRMAGWASGHSGMGSAGGPAGARPVAGPADLSDLAYTAAVRRSHHAQRLAVVAADPAALAAQLEAAAEALDTGMAEGLTRSDTPPKTVFVFPGQGGQWSGMGRALLAGAPVFRTAIERCDAALRPWVEWSLVEQLTLEADAPGHSLDRIEVIQPALVAIGIALAEQLRHWGIHPDAVIGHSLGEVAAAQVAGALSLEDALQVIVARSRLMQRLSGQGAMALVELSVAETEAVLGDLGDLGARAGVAVINGPRATVVSGDPEAIEALLATLGARDVFARRIQVDVASHGPQMAPLLPELRAALAGIEPRRGDMPIYSTTLAEVVDGHACDGAHWARNLRQPVHFGPMVQRLLDEGFTAFIELGPHPVLAPVLREAIAAAGTPTLAVATMRRDEDGPRTVLEALGELYVHGERVDWARVYPTGRCVQLPCYPWQRERHWLPLSPPDRPWPDGRSRQPADDPLPGRRLSNAVPTFETVLSSTDLSFAVEHRLFDCWVAPVAVHLELARAAACAALGLADVTLAELVLPAALVIPGDRAVMVQTTLLPDAAGGGTFRIHGWEAGNDGADGAWTLHATGALHQAAVPSSTPFDPALVKARCVEAGVASTVADPEAPAGGSGTGSPPQRWWRRDGEALAWIQAPAGPSDQAPAGALTAAILDAALRPARAALAGDDAVVVAGVERFWRVDRLPSGFWSHSRVRASEAPSPLAWVADVRGYDAEGRCVLAADGLRFHPLEAELSGERAIQAAASSWVHEVVWEPSASNVSTGATIRRDARGAASAESPGSWLLFADRGGLGAALAERLRAAGHGATIVRPGGHYGFRSDGTVAATLRPELLDDYQRLVADATTDDRPLRGVVFAWGLDRALAAGALPASLVADQVALLSQLTYLVRALVPVAADHGPRLWVVTEDAQPVTPTRRLATPDRIDKVGAAGAGPDGSDQAPPAAQLALSQAPLWGLGRVIAIEHPALWGGLVDLAAGEPGGKVDQVLAEISAPGAEGEDEIAWRGDRRYVPRLVPRAPGAGSTKIWRGDGAHLITGGLGGVGLALARWLARRGVRHLVLTSRTGLPDRAAWDELPGDGAVARRVARLRAIEALGAEVTVAVTDAGDGDQVERLTGRFGTALPPLRGVWHAAADLGGAEVTALSATVLGQLLRAKVAGAWALHRSTKTADLDAFVLFSSTTALWGARELGAYAAANTFLDGLAQHRSALGLPALSVNWGIWAEAGPAREIVDAGARVGLRPMPAEIALALMGRLVATGPAQAMVAAVDWPTFRAAYTARRPRPFLDRMGGASGARESLSQPTTSPGGPNLRRLWLDAAEAERRAVVTAFVLAEVAEVLGHARSAALDTRRGLFDLGLDSLLTLQLRRRLEAALGRQLSATVIFSHPTITALAGFIDALLAADHAGMAPGPEAASPAPAAQPAHVPAPDSAARAGATEDDLLRRFEATMAAVNHLVDAGTEGR